MKPLQTALVIIGAMLVGAGVTYWTIRQLPPPLVPVAPVPAEQADETPAPAAAFAPSAGALDESDLEAAIAAAKAARARGDTKPLATTPEEYARQLGSFTYRVARLTAAFPEVPEDGSAEANARAAEIDELTRFYANLTLDEDHLHAAPSETPEQIAHLQAHFAGGCLELDPSGVSRLEELLRRAFAGAPVTDGDPAADANLDAATEEIRKALMEFLSPEQKERLEIMGIEQVLFGFSPPEP